VVSDGQSDFDPNYLVSQVPAEDTITVEVEVTAASSRRLLRFSVWT